MSKIRKQFPLYYQGLYDGWYIFRATTYKTKKRSPLDSHKFENEVFEWCAGYTNGEYFISNDDLNGYTKSQIAFTTGNSLCVLFNSINDVLRFSRGFIIENFDKKAILNLK